MVVEVSVDRSCDSQARGVLALTGHGSTTVYRAVIDDARSFEARFTYDSGRVLSMAGTPDRIAVGTADGRVLFLFPVSFTSTESAWATT